MQKIIITGVNGRIGSRLREKLQDKYEIIGIDNEETHAVSFKNYFKIDFSSDKEMHKGFDAIYQHHGKDFYSVIHLVAYYSFQGGDYTPYDQITVQGTRRLLKELSRGNIEQLVFSSTLLVHKPCKVGEKIREDSPINARWEYPKSKIEAEKVIINRRQRFSAAILRICGCYDEDCHAIPIARHISRIDKQSLESHFYPGDLQSGAPYLHFEDLVEGIIAVIEKKDSLENDEVFLMGEEETLTFKELQTQIGNLLWNKPWKTYPIPKWVAKLGAYLKKSFIQPWMIDFTDDYYALDLSKSKRLLNWSPKHSLRKTLPIMIKNLKKDRARWYVKNKIPL
ncbi:MAG: NAD(P)-dependent oxidoreductase [Chlamydiia bacterium]|nr:NAD(P)-dependent oxidoreductase [Chlamydiia bacterium]